MRIITGKHKGRILKTLEGIDTRPMMDRMKETIFNVIGPYFNGGVVLDLFGGCGSLGIEAISRGVDYVYFNDLSYRAYKIIEENINIIKEKDKVKLLMLDYSKAIKYLHGIKFDLVFLDPPYRMNVINNIIELLYENLNDNAYIICQGIKGNIKTEVRWLSVIKHDIYGVSEFIVFKVCKDV